MPLDWFPHLLRASPSQRQDCRIGPSGHGLHWEALDEDISVSGLLAGRGDMTAMRQAAAWDAAYRRRRTTLLEAIPASQRPSDWSPLRAALYCLASQ